MPSHKNLHGIETGNNQELLEVAFSQMPFQQHYHLVAATEMP